MLASQVIFAPKGKHFAAAAAVIAALATITACGDDGDSTASTGALRWLFGTRNLQSLKCNPTSQEAVCGYTVSQLCWARDTPGNGPCAPWMQLPVSWTPPAAVGGQGQLASAGAPAAPGDLLQFAVPVANGGQVLLQVHHPKLVASVTTAQQGQPAGPLGWRQVQGTLCGAVSLADLDAALAGLPQSTLDALGGVEAARKVRAQLLPGDLDLNGDGQIDAASTALSVTGTRATITGLSPLLP